MGGRGASSGKAGGSLNRSQMADRITDLRTENESLFKTFFRQDKNLFQKERATYAKNRSEIDSLRQAIQEMDKKKE